MFVLQDYVYYIEMNVLDYVQQMYWVILMTRVNQLIFADTFSQLS